MKRAAAATFILSAGLTLAYADSGQVVQSPLFNIAGARSTAMGQAFTSVQGDIDSISINPAGTASLKDPWLATSYRRGVVDDSWGYVHFAHPTSFGALFVGGSYFDAGTIDVNFLSGLSESRKAQQDFAGLVGASFGKGWLSVGAAAKFIKMELAEEAKASGYAVDAGVQAQTSVDGLAVGLSGQNMGPDVKFEEESESIPQRVRYGLSYLLDFGKWGGNYKVLTAVDGVSAKDEGEAIHAGLDITHDLTFFEKEGWVALRGGYESDAGSFSAGLGLGIHNFSLDYAVRFHSDIDESHFATLGYRFVTAESKPEATRKKSESSRPKPSISAPRRRLE